MFSAFLFLEWQNFKAYRFKALINIVDSLLIISIFYFLSKSIGPQKSFKGEYFPFVIIGLAFNQMVVTFQSSAISSLYEWRLMGTIEMIFASPNKRWQVLLFGGLPECLKAVVKAMIFLLLAYFFIESAMTPKWLWILSTTLLSFILFQGYALLGLTTMLLWKKVNISSSFAATAAMILSGVYFPTSNLPNFLQFCAKIIPFTHILVLFRWGFLGETYSFEPVTSLLVLILWTVILTPLSLWCFLKAENHLLKTGKLTTI